MNYSKETAVNSLKKIGSLILNFNQWMPVNTRASVACTCAIHKGGLGCVAANYTDDKRRINVDPTSPGLVALEPQGVGLSILYLLLGLFANYCKFLKDIPPNQNGGSKLYPSRRLVSWRVSTTSFRVI